MDASGDGKVRRDVAERLEEAAAVHWNQFYLANGNKFYKDRHWFAGEFGEHVAGKRVFLEVGCGTGSTIYPLLDVAGGDSRVYACDFAHEAVELVRRHPGYPSGRVTVFPADITQRGVFRGNVPASVVETCMMVFVLSAISPHKMPGVLENVWGVLAEGGVVCLRDYAQGDLCEKRMAGEGRRRELSQCFYVRGDSTRCFYFSIDVLDGLFAQSGFQPVERARVLVKEELNRKTGEVRIRRYIQAVYQKVAKAGCEEGRRAPDPFAGIRTGEVDLGDMDGMDGMDDVDDVDEVDGMDDVDGRRKLEEHEIGCLKALKIPPARLVDRFLAMALCSSDIMGVSYPSWVTHSIEVVSASSSGLLSFACLQAPGIRRHICCASSPSARARIKRVFTENSSRFLWERLRVGGPDDVDHAQRIVLEWRQDDRADGGQCMLLTAAGVAFRTGAQVVAACAEEDLDTLLERAGRYGLTLSSQQGQSLNQRMVLVLFAFDN